MTKLFDRITVICLLFLVTTNNCLKAQEVDLVKNLPLQLSDFKGNSKQLVIYLTGDGGWNSFNLELVHSLEKHGYGVVALNTRKYFWNEKSPESFASDFTILSNYYLKEWNKAALIIVGYSFGADVASFLPIRLPSDLQNKIVKVVLLSPSASNDFVIRLSDMVGETENVNRKYKVGPEIEKSGLPVVCLFGKEEQMSLKNSLKKSNNLTVIEVTGDHRYNQNPELVLKMVGM